MHIQYAGFLRTRTLSQRSRDRKQTAQSRERRPASNVGVRRPSAAHRWLPALSPDKLRCNKVRWTSLLYAWAGGLFAGVPPKKTLLGYRDPAIDPLMSTTLVAHPGITRWREEGKHNRTSVFRMCRDLAMRFPGPNRYHPSAGTSASLSSSLLARRLRHVPSWDLHWVGACSDICLTRQITSSQSVALSPHLTNKHANAQPYRVTRPLPLAPNYDTWGLSPNPLGVGNPAHILRL